MPESYSPVHIIGAIALGAMFSGVVVTFAHGRMDGAWFSFQ
ncbi:MAG: hypothetical protein ACJ71N_02550 [Terriglobales bacterium]